MVHSSSLSKRFLNLWKQKPQPDCESLSATAEELSLTAETKVFSPAAAEVDVTVAAAERALEPDRDERYAALVRNSSDAIIFHDLHGIITGWNLGAELILGFSEVEMKGKHINTVLLEDYRKLYWSNVAQLRNFSRLPSFEMQFCTKEEDTVFVAATISEICGTKSDTTTVSLIARDVTRQKEAEQHISELYAMVSHELRTPLTSLRGSLTILDENMVDVNSEDGRAMLKIARQGTEKLLKIVNDILDVRKLEAGRMQFHREVVKADELIDQCILVMQNIAHAHGVKLTKAVAEDVHISADRERIIQVLINFISNAIKHSNAGDEVQIQAVLRRSGNVRFSVVDSGPGISKDKHASLFQKFHYVSKSANSSSLAGAGLGLAICKSIVHQHEGTVGLDSEEGKGSVFWFELKALGKQIRTSGTMTVDAIRHALIVSDNDMVVRTLHKGLMKNSVGCRLIARVDDVVPITKSSKPFAVFIDSNFAGAQLLDLLQQINAASPDTKTIAFRCSADDAPTFSYPVQITVMETNGDEFKSDVNDRCFELTSLVRQKFAPLQGYPIEQGNGLVFARDEMSPADVSFAILNLQQLILAAKLTEDEFLRHCRRLC